MTELKKYNNIYFSCVDCNWEGNISECDFDTEYDEFKRWWFRYNKYI